MAIQLSKNGNAVKFDFDDNSHYLNDGTIEVPVNSLTLVTDESDMFTFKKAASDDIFISGLYEEIGMSKSELIAWYKDNMVGSTGGGGGVTSGDVETMISEATSGLAESSAVTEEISAAVSGKADTTAVTASINSAVSGKMDTDSFDSFYNSDYLYYKQETNEAIEGLNSAVSGKVNTTDFNTYSASTDARLSEDEEVTSAALNELNDALDDKADTTAVTASIAAAVSGKQDTLIAGTNIKTVNNESLLGSGNIDIQGGGKAIEAGRGIAITTGATADTVSFDLPISAGTGINSLVIGDYNSADHSGDSKASGRSSIAGGSNCTATTNNSFAFGYHNKASGGATSNGNFAQGYMTTASGNRCHSEGLGTSSTADASHSEGYNTTASGNYSHSEGEEVKATNVAEHSQGRYNVSNKANTTWGDSGNTLFSVGNGTADNARHNAFEIRQNGDIYITKDGSDVKLQDQLGGGGLPESAFTAYTAATEARLAEDEEVTAAALTTLNTATAANTTALGGLKLVQLTQAAYDALVSGGTVDASTLYIITSSN